MADDNRPLKYMRYAIGEILLVVIGILIALQLNTMREEHKQITKTNVYIDKLINDLINDTININKSMDQRKEFMNKVNYYFEYFEEGNHSINQLIDSLVNIGGGLWRYLPVDYTFKDMQSSGNSNLLKEEQRISLIELSNQQDFFKIINEKSILAYYKELHESNKYLDADNSKSDFYEILKIEQNEKHKGLLHLHNGLSFTYNLAYIFIERGSTLKEMSKKSILLLQAQKNN